MDDASFVRGFQRLGDLLGYRQGFVNRNGSLRDPISEGGTRYQFQDQRFLALGFFQPVDVADVGVVQRGQHFGFAFKPCEAIWIIREGLRQDLERDLPVELGIGGLVDLSHATLANEGGHIVAPYALESHWIRPETEEVIASSAARA